jgi:hypothetical protein
MRAFWSAWQPTAACCGREGAAKAREMADKAKAAAAVLDEQHAISARVRATVHGLDDERSLRDKVGAPAIASSMPRRKSPGGC